MEGGGDGGSWKAGGQVLDSRIEGFGGDLESMGSIDFGQDGGAWGWAGWSDWESEQDGQGKIGEDEVT